MILYGRRPFPRRQNAGNIPLLHMHKKDPCPYPRFHEDDKNVRRFDHKSKTPCVHHPRFSFSVEINSKSAVRVSTMFGRQVGRYPPNSVPVCPRKKPMSQKTRIEERFLGYHSIPSKELRSYISRSFSTPMRPLFGLQYHEGRAPRTELASESSCVDC
jgi:hypothetical protein